MRYNISLRMNFVKPANLQQLYRRRVCARSRCLSRLAPPLQPRVSTPRRIAPSRLSIPPSITSRKQAALKDSTAAWTASLAGYPCRCPEDADEPTARHRNGAFEERMCAIGMAPLKSECAPSEWRLRRANVRHRNGDGSRASATSECRGAVAAPIPAKLANSKMRST
jgi:hypothetical protein